MSLALKWNSITPTTDFATNQRYFISIAKGRKNQHVFVLCFLFFYYYFHRIKDEGEIQRNKQHKNAADKENHVENVFFWSWNRNILGILLAVCVCVFACGVGIFSRVHDYHSHLCENTFCLELDRCDATRHCSNEIGFTCRIFALIFAPM